MLVIIIITTLIYFLMGLLDFIGVYQKEQEESGNSLLGAYLG